MPRAKRAIVHLSFRRLPLFAIMSTNRRSRRSEQLFSGPDFPGASSLSIKKNCTLPILEPSRNAFLQHVSASAFSHLVREIRLPGKMPPRNSTFPHFPALWKI